MNLDFRCESCKHVLERDVQDMGCVIVCPECSGMRKRMMFLVGALSVVVGFVLGVIACTMVDGDRIKSGVFVYEGKAYKITKVEDKTIKE